MVFSQVFSGIAELDKLVYSQFIDYLGDLTAKTQKTFVNSNTEPSQAVLQEAYKEALGRNVAAPEGTYAFWFNPTDEKIRKVYKNSDISLGFQFIGLDVSDPDCGIIESFVLDDGELGIAAVDNIDFSGWSYALLNFRLRLVNAVNLGNSSIRWNNDVGTNYYYNQKYHRGDAVVANAIQRGLTALSIPNTLANTVIPGSTANAAYLTTGLGVFANLNNNRAVAAWFANQQFLSNVSGEVTLASATRWASSFAFHAHIIAALKTTRVIITTANAGYAYGSKWVMVGLK